MRTLSMLIASGALLGACSDDGSAGGCVCTQEFRLFTLTVVDSLGRPEASVAIEVRSRRTGRLIEVPGGYDGVFGEGTYVIFSDAELDLLPDEGEPVLVTGEKDTRSFGADFLFAPEGSCRCHVTRVSGPDTVTIR